MNIEYFLVHQDRTYWNVRPWNLQFFKDGAIFRSLWTFIDSFLFLSTLEDSFRRDGEAILLGGIKNVRTISIRVCVPLLLFISFSIFAGCEQSWSLTRWESNSSFKLTSSNLILLKWTIIYSLAIIPSRTSIYHFASITM